MYTILGAQYGMNFMKTMLTKVVRKYRIETKYKSVEDVKLTMKVALAPKDGFHVKFTPRINQRYEVNNDTCKIIVIKNLK